MFFELLRTHLLLRPALTAAVAIAEPRLDRTQSAGAKLIFYPFLPWPWPNVIGAHFVDGDPDTLWLMPRELIVEEDSDRLRVAVEKRRGLGLFERRNMAC